MSNRAARGDCWPNSGNDIPKVADMLMRDYFAAQALSGIVSGGTKGDPIDTLAELSYRLADAMLMERAK